MRKFSKISIVALISGMLLFSCECKHVDVDLDHKCDKCGEVISDHVDENHNHKCDMCKEVISDHIDENHDHRCDICNKVLNPHIDENRDHICDYCSEKITSCTDDNHDFRCDICGRHIYLIEGMPETLSVGDVVQLKINSAEGFETLFNWSVSEDSPARISDDGELCVFDVGKITVIATSKFIEDKDFKLTASAVSYDQNMIEKGFVATNQWPEEELKNFIGNKEYNLYRAPKEVVEQGLYYKINESTDEFCGSVEIYFNLNIALDRAVEKYETVLDSIFGSKNLNEFRDFMNDDSFTFIDQSMTYMITVYISHEERFKYPGILFERVDEVFKYDEKLTSNNDWTDEEKFLMNTVLGSELPFVKMGEHYEMGYLPENNSILIYDFSKNYKVRDSFTEALVLNGFHYCRGFDVYQKVVGDNLSILVSVEFSTAGNVIEAYLDCAIMDAFPQQLLDYYIVEILGSKYNAIGFNLQQIPIHEYKAFIADDTEDIFPYSDSYLYVCGLYGNKQDYDRVIEEFEKLGFTSHLVPSNDPEVMSTLVLEKGIIEIDIILYPLIFDRDFEVYDLYNKCGFAFEMYVFQGFGSEENVLN